MSSHNEFLFQVDSLLMLVSEGGGRTLTIIKFIDKS